MDLGPVQGTSAYLGALCGVVRALHAGSEVVESLVLSLLGENGPKTCPEQCTRLWELNALAPACGPGTLEGLFECAERALRESRSQAEFYLSVKLLTNVVDAVKSGQVQEGREPSETLRSALMRSLEL